MTPPSAPFVVAPLRINWRMAVVGMAFLVVVFALLALPIAPATAPNRLRVTLQPQLIMWGLWLLLSPLVVAASRRAHTWGITTWRGISIHIVSAATLALLHAVIWGVIRWQLSTSPDRDLGRMTASIVSFVYGGNLLRYFVIACVYHALAYRSEAHERMVAQARLAAHLAEARLEALESRLHPHFLFNTLNTITALIRKDPPAAIGVVENLGDLLRATLRSQPGSDVPLSVEIALLEKYVAIQRVRFQDRLTVAMLIDRDTLDARVPQLILQPFVENAILHGIAPREAPGTVTIAAIRNAEKLTLTVADDGVGFGRATSSPRANGETHHGIGINNSRARLHERFGDRVSLEIAPTDPSGTRVTITIPYDDGAV